MNYFPSLVAEDKKSSVDLDKINEGNLFHTIEYSISDIVNKISNIDNLDEKEIENIIIMQYSMILNYDLFLMSPDTRVQAQTLFTNKKFLNCFLNVSGCLSLNYHQKICINKLAYDYYITPDNDPEVSTLLYRLTNRFNSEEVVYLSSILGFNDANILAMIRNSTFKEDKAVRRVNKYIIKCNLDLSVKNIIDIYYHLFERFTPVFIYSMMETRPISLNEFEARKFDNISVALLEMLNSLPESHIRKVINDYCFTIKTNRDVTMVRFSIKSAIRFTRIISIVRQVEIAEDIIIP